MRYHAFVENISMGGLCVSSERSIPPGAQLEINIPLSTGGGIIVRPEVVRSYIGGAAMRFH